MSESYYERFEDSDPELESILDKVPWEDVPRKDLLPEMLFHFKCIDIYTPPLYVNDDGTEEKARVVAVFEILAPAEFADRFHRENFTVGTEADKKAQDPRTWLKGGNFAITNLSILREFVGGRTWRDIQGKELLAFIRHNKTGEYGNIVYSTLLHPGEAQPGTPTPAGKGRVRRPATNNSYAAAQGGATQPCPICRELFPNTEIVAHISSCQNLVTTP